MALKRRISLRNISTVAASGTVVIELPIGPRYHTVILQHGFASGTNTIAAAATNISEIRCKLNGRVQRVFSGTHLRALNVRNGAQYDAYTGEVPNTAPGVSFPIHFAEPFRKQPAAQELTAWATAWKGGSYDSFQIEVALSTASTPTLIAWAVVDDLIPDTQQNIVKWLRHSVGASGTSFDWQLPDRRDFLQEVNVFAPTIASSGTITKVTLRKDGIVLHELSSVANAALLYNFGMAPILTAGATNHYDVVLDHDDLLGSAVNMNGSRDATLTIEADQTMSASATIYLQRLGPPE